MGSALPALRRTVDLQKKSKSLVVLSCHRPGLHKGVWVQPRKGLPVLSRSPQTWPRDWLPMGTVPGALPGKGCCTQGRLGTHLALLSQARTQLSPLGGLSAHPTKGT